METIEYRTVDKSMWREGPWQNEYDKKQWQDEETGLPCLVVRGPIGALCGYVGVPKSHPLHGEEYWGIDVDVHWGLTYAGLCAKNYAESEGVCHKPSPGEPDNVWWFGFDCAHSGDDCDPMGHRSSYSDPGDVYRDTSFVERECRSLARQLFAMSEDKDDE